MTKRQALLDLCAYVEAGTHREMLDAVGFLLEAYGELENAEKGWRLCSPSFLQDFPVSVLYEIYDLEISQDDIRLIRYLRALLEKETGRGTTKHDERSSDCLYANRAH